jgi:hypothetical protein
VQPGARRPPAAPDPLLCPSHQRNDGAKEGDGEQVAREDGPAAPYAKKVDGAVVGGEGSHKETAGVGGRSKSDGHDGLFVALVKKKK